MAPDVIVEFIDAGGLPSSHTKRGGDGGAAASGSSLSIKDWVTNKLSTSPPRRQGATRAEDGDGGDVGLGTGLVDTVEVRQTRRELAAAAAVATPDLFLPADGMGTVEVHIVDEGRALEDVHESAKKHSEGTSDPASDPRTSKKKKAPGGAIVTRRSTLMANVNQAALRRHQRSSLSSGRKVSTWHAPDAYSFGVIMWEILTLKVPWEGFAMRDIWTRVKKGERPPLTAEDEASAPEGYVALLKQLWAQDPVERPTFEAAFGQLRRMALLAGLDVRDETGSGSGGGGASAQRNNGGRSYSPSMMRTTAARSAGSQQQPSHAAAMWTS